MKKRILALMLACFMIVSLLPMQVFAEETVSKCPGAGKDHVLENCTATAVETVPPTCVGWGYTIYECDVCGDHFTDDIEAKSDEHPLEYVEPIAPVCGTETDGLVGGYYCPICHWNEDVVFTVIPWEHEFDVVVGNCIEGTTKTCKVCGYVEHDARGDHCYIDPTTGEFLIESIIQPEGNTDPNLCGVGIYTCYFCNEKHEVQILHNLHYVPYQAHTMDENGNITWGWYAHYACETCDKTFTVKSVEGWEEFDYDIWAMVWIPGYLESLEALQGGYHYLDDVVIGNHVVRGLTKLVEWNPIDEHNHVYDHTNYTLNQYGHPTCGDATDVFVCTICEHEVYETYYHHTDVQWEHTTQPTCETWGVEFYFCTGCGESWAEEKYEPLGHNFTEWLHRVVNAPEGKYEFYRYCTRCGYEETNGFTNSEDIHDWVENEYMRLEPNCATLGHAYFDCYCGEQKHEVLERNDQHWFGDDEPVEILYPTCTEDGGEFYYCYWCDENILVVTDEYKALGHVLYTHVYQDCDSITTTVWCEYCDYEEHHEEELTPDRTLFFESVEEGVAAHSTYDTYSCENQREPWMSWGPTTVVTPNCYAYSVKEPTCGNIGYEHYSCTCCDGAFIAVLPATGDHIQMGYLQSVTVNADGYANGEYVYGIDFKGGLIEINVDFSNGYGELFFVNEEGKVIEPTFAGQDGNILCLSFYNVEYVEVRMVVYYGFVTVTPYLESAMFDGWAETCDEDGYTDYYYCAECRQQVGEVIPAHGRYTVHAENKAPTCSEDGWIKGDYCPVCDEFTHIDEEGNRYVVDSLVVEKLGHSIVVNYETYLDEGWLNVYNDERMMYYFYDPENVEKYFNYTHFICENGCGLEYIDEYHEHKWVKNTVLSYEAECLTDGLDWYDCECGAIWHDVLPALGHDFDCIANMEHCMECNRCGYEEEHEFIIIAHMPATCSVGAYDLYHCVKCGFEHSANYTLPDPDAHVYGPTFEEVDDNGNRTGWLYHVCTLCEYVERWEGQRWVDYTVSVEDGVVVPNSPITENSEVRVNIQINANHAMVWGFDVKVYFNEAYVVFDHAEINNEVFNYLLDAKQGYDENNREFIGIAGTCVSEAEVVEDLTVTLVFKAVGAGYTTFDLFVDDTLDLAGNTIPEVEDVPSWMIPDYDELVIGANSDDKVINLLMDVDFDWDIDLDDLRQCYLLMLASAEATGENIVADADQNGVIDIDDLVAIYNYILLH